MKSLTGQKGEQTAIILLRKNGYRILQTNYNCPFGEIDIICQKNKELVFVEVKARKSLLYGYPFESVTKNKLNKIKKSINYYLNQKKLPNIIYRIDVVSILFNDSGSTQYEILENVS